jgi:hypothetical protein
MKLKFLQTITTIFTQIQYTNCPVNAHKLNIFIVGIFWKLKTMKGGGGGVILCLAKNGV